MFRKAPRLWRGNLPHLWRGRVSSTVTRSLRCDARWGVAWQAWHFVPSMVSLSGACWAWWHRLCLSLVVPKRACLVVLLLFPVALILCSFSVWWSVWPAQLPKSIKTDLPSSSALHLLSCAPCSFWLSVLAAQRSKSVKTDFPSSPSTGLLGGAPCCVWWPALVREPPKCLKAGLPSCSFVLCPPFSCGCASVLLSLSATPFCPLSGPNPPKRTAPASTLRLLACAPCSVVWSVLAS